MACDRRCAIASTLQVIGKALKLDTSSNTSLWKDRVSLELNHAILQSFQKAGVTIVDQFTVSDQFQTHFNNEMKERGGCPADWLWLTPSLSGSLTPVFHQEMLHYHLSPCLERQSDLWKNYRYYGQVALWYFRAKADGSSFMGNFGDLVYLSKVPCESRSINPHL